MSDEDEAYVIATAKKHGGQYLLTRADWVNEADPMRQACERLVRAGRARWLGIKQPGEPGEPGPGIRLIGRDAAED